MSDENKSSEGETVESSAVQSTTVEIDDDWRNGDFFPLLLLPKEIIIIIFHLLSTADRLRARLCKALYQMEKEEKFTASYVMIAVPGVDDEDEADGTFIGIDKYNLDNTRAIIKKLRENVIIEHLELWCRQEDLILIPLIKTIPSEQFSIFAHDYAVSNNRDKWLNPYVTEATFDSWIKGRKALHIWGGFVGFSGADLFHLYTDMSTGKSEMAQLLLNNVRQESTRELLRLLGVTYSRREVAFRSTLKESSMYVVKDETDVDGEYESIFNSDNERVDVPFCSTAECLLFIVCGRYHNELAIERFDENGEVVDEMFYEYGACNVSIADMIEDTEKFEKLPPHVYRLEQ